MMMMMSSWSLERHSLYRMTWSGRSTVHCWWLVPVTSARWLFEGMRDSAAVGHFLYVLANVIAVVFLRKTLGALFWFCRGRRQLARERERERERELILWHLLKVNDAEQTAHKTSCNACRKSRWLRNFRRGVLLDDLGGKGWVCGSCLVEDCGFESCSELLCMYHNSVNYLIHFHFYKHFIVS
jgi:hypothetical protein